MTIDENPESPQNQLRRIVNHAADFNLPDWMVERIKCAADFIDDLENKLEEAQRK